MLPSFLNNLAFFNTKKKISTLIVLVILVLVLASSIFLSFQTKKNLDMNSHADTMTINYCRGDVNRDTVVDSVDLSLVSVKLNTKCSGCPEDVNFDNVVNRKDYNIVQKDLGCHATILTPIPSVTLTPPPVQLPYKVDVGGSGGQGWVGDTGTLDGSIINRGAISIANTTEPFVYQTERWGAMTYRFPIANGTYVVKLDFAETNPAITAPGQRVFNVTAENQSINNIDICLEARNLGYIQDCRYVAVSKIITTTVQDGEMTITFIPTAFDSPKVDGIEILQPNVTPTITPIPTATPYPTATIAPTQPPTPVPTQTQSHVFGIVGQLATWLPFNTNPTIQQEYDAGVRAWLIEAYWKDLQPNGQTDWTTSVIQEMQRRIDIVANTATDTKYILDLGMQYPPVWVGNTDPLKDQYGNYKIASPTNGGGVNVYWSPTVRQYTAQYIQKLFTSLNFHGKLWAVRVGPAGGEMMFPEQRGSDGGQSFWAFDANAMASNPVPNWRPGQASPNGEAQTFYNWYVDRVANTFNFILGEVRHYYAGYVAPVTPGYGIYNATAQELVSRNLVDSSKCCYGTGNYWQRLFPEFAPSAPNILAWCSSFGDGSGSDDSSQDSRNWSSAHLLSSYASQIGRPIFGENPGRNAYSPGQCSAPAKSDMQWDFATMQTYNYKGLMWVREEDFRDSNASCYANLNNLDAMTSQYP